MGVWIENDNRDAFTSGINKAIASALEEMGQVAEGYAKRKCPVDTGNLRKKITHQVSGDKAYIGTNVAYAAYVELGTSRQKEQPYLRPAAADHASTYQNILRKHLNS